MKELAEHRFHSKHLVPYAVAQKGQDAIIEWIETEQQGNRFTDGDEVAHKENPELKMYVKEILKEVHKIKNGIDDKGNPIYKQQIRMLGILCYYWKDAKGGDTV